jgi:hypothetical protein
MTMRERAQAFGGGVVGAVAMMAAAKALGSPVMRDLSRLSGSMVLEPRTASTRVAGTAMQLLNGGLLAQGYLEAMSRLRPAQSGWQDGLAIGVMHGIVAGMLLGVVPAIHPRVPEEVPPPGWFMSRRGSRGTVALIALHALFGAVVGAAIGGRSAAPASRATGNILPMSHAG